VSLKKRTTRSGYELYEVGECPECGSTEWEGYQRCVTCHGYYPDARCTQCGHMRLSECLRDEGKLEFHETKWHAPSEG
jgi:hypothetical protein